MSYPTVRFKAEVEVRCRSCWQPTIVEGTVTLNEENIEVESVPSYHEVYSVEFDAPEGWRELMDHNGNRLRNRQLYCSKECAKKRGLKL